MRIPREYEQNFDDLEEWLVINKNHLKSYFGAAELSGVKLAYKTKNKNAQLFCEPDQDMTEFFDKLNELKNEN